jgi:hypothetical protein
MGKETSDSTANVEPRLIRQYVYGNIQKMLLPLPHQEAEK